MIPKVIHYCWFGGKEKPELIKRCILSWKRYCPDYKIIEWNENNFEIDNFKFAKQAYDEKKWAFVSDYVRIYVLCKYGGVYLDTDVELYKSLDDFLCDEAFTGFETKDSPVTAVMGSEKDQKMFSYLLDYYDAIDFKNGTDAELKSRTNTVIITNIFKEKGIEFNNKKQVVFGCTIYPEVVFCPNDIYRLLNKHSKKSYSIHHYMGSWGDNTLTSNRTFIQRVRMYLVRICRDIFGTERSLNLFGKNK